MQACVTLALLLAAATDVAASLHSSEHHHAVAEALRQIAQISITEEVQGRLHLQVA